MTKTTIAQIDSKKIYKTPKGEAIWPKIVIPETKFNPAGVYEIRMKFNPGREKELWDQLDELNEIAYQQLCREKFQTQLPREKPPWKLVDGRWVFKFKLNASGVLDGKPWTNDRPKLFDSRGARIEDPIQVGNGCEVRVYFQVRPSLVQQAAITL